MYVGLFRNQSGRRYMSKFDISTTNFHIHLLTSGPRYLFRGMLLSFFFLVKARIDRDRVALNPNLSASKRLIELYTKSLNTLNQVQSLTKVPEITIRGRSSRKEGL